MPDGEVERHLQEFLAEARELGMTIDEATAREKVEAMVAQAHEHGVSVEAIKRRNLMRELFGGGARPSF